MFYWHWFQVNNFFSLIGCDFLVLPYLGPSFMFFQFDWKLLILIILSQNDAFLYFRSIYCRIQRNWRLGFNLSCEACDNPISLNFLHNNLVLICVHFWWLQNFSDHRWFFWSCQKKKWQGFSKYFQNGQLEWNFLTFISAQCWNFPISESWDIGDLKKIVFLGNFANFTPKSKVKILKIGPNCSLRLQK
jgi:hypothetical protein